MANRPEGNGSWAHFNVKSHPYDFLSSDFFSSLNFGQVTYKQAICQLYDFLSSDFFSSVNFGQVTDRKTDIQTDCDAYEPTVHRHRWAKKCTAIMEH